jgi:perosamine synthetase
MKPEFVPVAKPTLHGNEKRYVQDCLDTGWISSAGQYIERFESAFAEYCGVQFAAACCNGTVALHLALLAAGVGPGDEVIVPTLTYIASANSVRYCGATCVLVDSDPRTMNLDVDAVVAAITPRTKAIIAVHLYGHPADMVALRRVAHEHGIALVEDAAEAHGAEQNGIRTGGLGDIATFSFFGNKVITTGEGGMVTTNDAEMDRTVRLLRGQGQDPQRRYWFPVVGYNYRMTNIEAAIGLAQLEDIAWHLGERRRVASAYDAAFGAALAGVQEQVQLPSELPGYKNSFWLYTIVLRESSAEQRDQLMGELAEAGFETRPVFYPMHVMPPYASSQSFPVAEQLSAGGLNLPTHADVTEAHTEAIAAIVASHLKRRQ